MKDDVLDRLDEGFARRAAAPAVTVPRRMAPPPPPPDREELPARVPLRDRYPWAEAFVGIQFLWGALLFIPGSQDYRVIIRALPYVSSAVLFALYFPAMPRTRHPSGTILVIGALALLVVNLLHPTSQLYAGIAQCVFQATIALPLFWVWKATPSPERFYRLLRLAFVLNALGAAVGLLQVYFPDQFMPPQFSTLGLQMNEYLVDSLTYQGADGRLIVRPPGLSDLPGGASISGALTAVLGIALSLRARSLGKAMLFVGPAACGLAVIYLTQVRSLLLVAIVSIVVVAAVALRQGRLAAGSMVLTGGAGLVVGAFLFASSLGGEAVEDRFLNLAERGAMQAYQDSRGHFLSYTVGELLDQFPLGAGIGRWGMMHVYFGDPTLLNAQPIYVEIQLTGWLLDGGFPMWLLYGGGLFLAVLGAYRLARQRRSPEMADLAVAVIGVQAFILGTAMAGPAFNTQLGAFFWIVSSGLHGAARDLLPQRRRLYL